jgi:glutamine synthetase
MAKKVAAPATASESEASKVMEMIREHSVEYVDLRFTDPRGKWQHTAQHISTVDEESLGDGFMFDGSSIAGWKAINESDMILMPDCATATLDPFAAKPSLILFCDIIEPSTGQYYARDPRATAKLAEAYLKSTGIGDTIVTGAEAEFFIFDSVRFGTAGNYGTYHIDSIEGPEAKMKDYPEGNMGHRPGIKGGYFPVPPVDSESDLRAEMLSTMGEMGLVIEKHHHEVAQSQHELGTRFTTLTKMADQMQIYKYCVHNVAHSYGKTATFMPKPIYGDNGTGMHTHQSIWKDGKPLFAGNGYADLSEMCLHYIGGIIKHAKALNAFTNPSTNSYKRLIPGFEAPVLLAYSSRNRSASCRIPYTTSPKGKRVEVRFPDPSANPYLAYAALLMAGLDGIRNKIHPGDPMDKDLYDLPPEELKDIPTVCGSLREALGALAADHEFLLQGDVFSTDQIESYIELKWNEVYRFEHTPHPVEFEMYYSV